MNCIYCRRNVVPDEKGSCPYCGAPVSERLDPGSAKYDEDFALAVEADRMASYIFWKGHEEVLGESISKTVAFLMILFGSVAGFLLGWILMGGF